VRILYLCTDPGIDLMSQGGGSIHIRAFVSALRHLNHEVTVTCHAASNESTDARNGSRDLLPLRLGEWNRALASSIRGANRLAGSRGRYHPDLVRGLHNLTAFRLAARHVRAHRPNFIYERNSLWGMTGLWLARKYSLPLVLEVNAPLAYEQKQYRGLTFSSLAEWTERMIWCGADLIVVVSESLRRHLQEAGVRPERIRVLPNAVDANLFHNRLDGEPVRKRFHLGSRFVVGFLGTFKQWHGADLLMEAFQRLHQGDPDMHLLLVGDGPLRESLQEKIRQAGLEHEVTLAGKVTHQEVPLYLATMDVAVAPYPDLSKFYFSPLKLFEYMAAGRAIVASRLGQIAEVIVDGESGLLFKPGDVEDLVRCIRRLREDSRLRLALGKQASMTSRSYTWSKNASQVVAWVEALVGGDQQLFLREERGVA
jgi:glycosyltransferase involved in cell wall biosynthesis